MEEILKLKDKLGNRVFKETILGTSNDRKKRNENRMFKRENKNRPREMSSKRPVTQVREIYQVKKDKFERRDPRFDEECGKFNEKIFKQTYKFIDEIKNKEMEKLKRELKKTKDKNRQKEIKYLIQRMENQKRAEEEKQKRVEIEKRIRNPEEGTSKFVNKCNNLAITYNFNDFILYS